MKKHLNLIQTVFVYLFLGIGLQSIYAQDNLGLHNISKLQDRYNELGGIFRAKNSIVEDSLGILWMGTSKGLCRYSGSTIDCLQHIPEDKNSLDGNQIMFLMLDSEHLIWTSIHQKGINVLDIHGKKIYDFDYAPNQENGLLHDRVWGMWEDHDGHIWISYFYGGLSRYDKSKDLFTHYSIDDEEFLAKHRPKTVVSVLEHDIEPHTYWLATTVGLVKFNTRTQEFSSFLFEKKIKAQTTESQYNKSKVSPLWSRSMCRDANGNLWLGTFGALVFFDTANERFEVVREIDDVIINSVPGVMMYDKDHIMLSFSEGLALLNTTTRKLKVLYEEDGASRNHRLFGRMYKATNGCVYILSRSGAKRGIHKYCPTSDLVKDYQTHHYVSKLLVTDNYVHYHRNPGKIESRNLNTGEKITHSFEIENGTIIQSFCKLSGDSLLVSDYYHMYYYHPKSGLTKIEALSQMDSYRHESVFVDSDGDIWNGRQRDGLYLLDDKTNLVKKYNHKSIPSLVYQDYIVDFLEDKDGDIWIATEQGWTIFDKKENTTRNYLSKDVGAEAGIDIRTISAFAQTEEGKIWIADGSFGLLEWGKEMEEIVTFLNRTSGLRSSGIYDIEIDPDNNLWLATEKGLTWVDSKTKEVKNFGPEIGVNRATYTLDFDDRILYAGHSSGYYHVSIDSLLKFEATPPMPMITGFELYDRVQDSLLFMEEGIELDHDQNFFSFSFGSINYYNPDLEEYQFRLEGIDQDWIKDRGDKKKGYTNISPGKYSFQVRVKAESEHWSEPATVDVVVKPTWYQTVWFRIALALMTGIVAWLLIQNYLARKRREIEVDKRFAQLETMILKSQMNPHFIFNSLNSIRYLFMKDEKEKGLKYITKFAKLLRTTLHHGDQALVNLEDEIELTELFVQLEELRFEDTFSFTSNYSVSGAWKNVKIPPFVIQPIVENAFWHGLLPSEKENKNLDLSIREIKGGFEILVEDNGVGLKSTSEHTVDKALNKTKSYGLNILRERFELMNRNEQTKYNLEIVDSPNNESGVLVRITILENK